MWSFKSQKNTRTELTWILMLTVENLNGPSAVCGHTPTATSVRPLGYSGCREQQSWINSEMYVKTLLFFGLWLMHIGTILSQWTHNRGTEISSKRLKPQPSDMCIFWVLWEHEILELEAALPSCLFRAWFFSSSVTKVSKAWIS